MGNLFCETLRSEENFLQKRLPGVRSKVMQPGKHFVENFVFSAIFHLMLSPENIFIISTPAMLQVEHGLPVIKSNQREGMTSSKRVPSPHSERSHVCEEPEHDSSE